MMNIRDLQYLTVLADELSFSRAADRLNISQPTLSQTVRKLERHIGGPLVERTTRRSRLTPAGETLVEGSRQLLADLLRLEQVTRDAAAGRTAALRIGAVNPAMRLLMPRILSSVRAEVPDVRMTLHPMNSHAQLRQLIDGQLEAGILRSRSTPTGLAVDTLMDEPLYAAVASSHPLATRGLASIAELNDEDFIMAPRDRNPVFYDELLRLVTDNQCSPRRIVEADDMWAQLAMVGAGAGVAVLPLLFVDHTRDDIVFLPLDRKLGLGLPLVLVYAPNSPSAALTAVRRAARAEAEHLLEAHSQQSTEPQAPRQIP
ncbi:LysR family transcriptional regulator [Rhodococcus opacus]|uniref:Putative LysR family transcriptional regulator n=1 Tax=Rhodococcus opacus (strain B4) TaxID=632772 RepID=C1B6T3_RHOOB|nr:LysR family transcriptional regulator [Rhodococcus opacus]BAH51386.1 putative LysR family transcriptional regulator [Rhodococcus opacus B4]